jgi:uncharacterized protein YndB with AHSA1/START domain
MAAAKIVSKSIDINAPVSRVWDVLTNPDLIKLWMSETEIDIVSDWRPGSPIIVRGELHGISYENKGTILQFEPDKAFKYSYWSNLSRVPDIPENYSVIDFRLTPLKNQTALTVTHSNIVGDATYKHSEFYWNVTIDIMKRLIENSDARAQIVAP